MEKRGWDEGDSFGNAEQENRFGDNMPAVLGTVFDEGRREMIKRFFQQLLQDIRNATGDPENSRENRHSLELAASVILLETAATDKRITDDELSEITNILHQQFRLSRSETDALLDAAENARRTAVDLHQFTQIINESCSRDQKATLIEYVWRIIYTDGRLDRHEDHLVHKLARLLHIDHKDFIAAKLKIRTAAGIHSPVDTQNGKHPSKG